MLDEARMEHKSFMTFYKFSVTARLERYIREINATQSKVIILRNDLSNDYELEEFDDDYTRAVRDKIDGLDAMLNGHSETGYFTKMHNDIDNVIEANDKLLARLYETKRSYAKAEEEIKYVQNENEHMVDSSSNRTEN